MLVGIMQIVRKISWRLILIFSESNISRFRGNGFDFLSLHFFYRANKLALSSKDIVNRKWAEIKTSMVGNQ
jgi:hypothetical protein